MSEQAIFVFPISFANINEIKHDFLYKKIILKNGKFTIF